MRSLSELNLNEGGEKVTAAPPTPEQFALFERTFDVSLPDSYNAFLLYSNGGHPELDTFKPKHQDSEDDLECVNRFYQLTDVDDEHFAPEDLWQAAAGAIPILGPHMIPIADNGGGDEIILDCRQLPAKVLVWVQEGEHFREIADTFEEFLDLLFCDDFE